MIFQKNLVRELTVTAAAVFTILLAILVTTQTINLLGRAVRGSIAVDAVFALVGFVSLGFFPVLLTLTVFITVLTVMTRYWRDHEMAVWLSSGVPLRAWIKPVMRFTIPIAILIFVLVAFVNSWAEFRSKEYSDSLQQREELSVVAPGIFKESKSADIVYFIESFAPVSGEAKNIFVQGKEKEKPSTIFAKTGTLKVNERGERVLTLFDGRRYVGNAGESNFESIEFKKFTAIIDRTPRPIVAKSWFDSSIIGLMNSNKNQDKSELVWRLSMPIMALILAFLAIPLSYFNTRSGHAYNLIMAFLVYFVYQGGFVYLRSLIADGQFGVVGILPIHIVMLLFGWFLLRYRTVPNGSFLSTASQALQIGKAL